MPFTGIADPEQLAMLRQALEEYCRARGITDQQGRDKAALLVMSIFRSGSSTLEELKAALTFGQHPFQNVVLSDEVVPESSQSVNSRQEQYHIGAKAMKL
jgi:hypothetical protein